MEMDMSHISLDDGVWLAVGDWLAVGEGCAETDGPELGDDDGGAVGPSLGAVLVVGNVDGTADGTVLGRCAPAHTPLSQTSPLVNRFLSSQVWLSMGPVA